MLKYPELHKRQYRLFPFSSYGSRSSYLIHRAFCFEKIIAYSIHYHQLLLSIYPQAAIIESRYILILECCLKLIRFDPNLVLGTFDTLQLWHTLILIFPDCLFPFHSRSGLSSVNPLEIYTKTLCSHFN